MTRRVNAGPLNQICPYITNPTKEAMRLRIYTPKSRPRNGTDPTGATP